MLRALTGGIIFAVATGLPASALAGEDSLPKLPPVGDPSYDHHDDEPAVAHAAAPAHAYASVGGDGPSEQEGQPLVLDGPSGAAEVDARPSDALNLALATGAPIRADRAMVDEVLTTEQGARDTVVLWEGQEVRGSRAILDDLMRPPDQSPD